MNPISLSEITRIVDGRLIRPSGSDPLIERVSTDSRIPSPNSLFIAIKGDTHDGHDKIGQAIDNGAVAALIDHSVRVSLPIPMVKVDDTRRAMGRLATHIRQKLRGKVIAIAGSNGKTSTKFLLHSVLKNHLRGSVSPKSFNNDIGVPLAIFPADPTDDYLALEIGTNHPGEVAHLSKLAQPDIAVITSIGAEHLEGLGDLDGVRKEESSIVAGLNRAGALIVNGDDEGVFDSIARYPGCRITFGLKPHNDLRAGKIQCGETGVGFTLNGATPVFVPQLGKHVASNALAVIATARLLGLSDEQIIDRLAKAHPADMRLELKKHQGLTLINDAYNANPASTRAALETLAALPAEKRRIAILGDMRELGATSAHYHKETGKFAAHSNLDVLICVGEQAKLIAQAAQEAGMPSRNIVHYADTSTAAENVPGALRKGDLILFKASRGIQLETIVNAIIQK